MRFLGALLLIAAGCAPNTAAEPQAPPTSTSSAEPASSAPPSRTEEERDASQHFEGADSTFVALDLTTCRTIRHGVERAGQRFSPASTFKIPHAMIALETGVASGPEFSLPFEPVRPEVEEWWPKTWQQDQTLATAIDYSAVWFFRETARRIGRERMQRYVDRFEYGDRNLEGAIDAFWLNGTLQISADEQVEFLERFFRAELGISAVTSSAVESMLVLEKGGGFQLSGKTGTTKRGERALGWLVGYVEVPQRIVVYAMNFEGVFWDRERRVGATKAILNEWGLCEPCAGAP